MESSGEKFWVSILQNKSPQSKRVDLKNLLSESVRVNKPTFIVNDSSSWSIVRTHALIDCSNQMLFFFSTNTDFLVLR